MRFMLSTFRVGSILENMIFNPTGFHKRRKLEVREDK